MPKKGDKKTPVQSGATTSALPEYEQVLVSQFGCFREISMKYIFKASVQVIGSASEIATCLIFYSMSVLFYETSPFRPPCM